jgi:hypothetical protein
VLVLFGLRALEIDQSERDFFPLAALYAVEANAIGENLVLADKLIFAVFQIELDRCCAGDNGSEKEREGGAEHRDLYSNYRRGAEIGGYAAATDAIRLALH